MPYSPQPIGPLNIAVLMQPVNTSLKLFAVNNLFGVFWAINLTVNQ